MGSKGFRAQVKALLLDAGCEFVRPGGKGSHEIWRSPRTQINFTFPKKLLSRHTANKVLKDAGIDQKV